MGEEGKLGGGKAGRGGWGEGEGGKRGIEEESSSPFMILKFLKNTLLHVLQRADEYTVLTTNKHKIGHNFKMG